MHRQVGRALCGHNARSLTDRHPERMAALHCAPLSDTTATYMQYGVETKVRVEELGFFLLDVPLSGACETVFGLERAHSTPGTILMAGRVASFHPTGMTTAQSCSSKLTA